MDEEDLLQETRLDVEVSLCPDYIKKIPVPVGPIPSTADLKNFPKDAVGTEAEPIPDLTKYNISVDSPVMIVFGEVLSPCSFFFHLSENFEDVNEIMSHMNAFYQTKRGKEWTLAPEHMVSGLFVAAPSQTNDVFHRARVIEFSGDKNVAKIFYVDYGCKMKINTYKLRYLHKGFMKLGVQGIPGRLKGVVKKSGISRKQQLEDERKFLVYISSKHFSCFDATLDVDNETYVLDLYDKSEPDRDIWVNGHVVDELQVAERAPEPGAMPSPFADLDKLPADVRQIVMEMYQLQMQKAAAPDTTVAPHSMALGAASLAPGPTLSGASSVTMPLASPVGGDARPPGAPATYPLPANAPEPRPTAVEVLARRCDDLEYFLTMENLNIHRQQVILNKLWETFGLLHPQIHTPEMEQTLHILSTVLGLAPPSPGSLLPPTSSPYVPLVPTFSPYDPYPLSAYPQTPPSFVPSSAAPVPLPAVAPSAPPPRPLPSPCPSRTPPAPAPPTRPPRLLPSWTPSQTKTAATTGNWPTLKTNTEEMETTRKVAPIPRPLVLLIPANVPEAVSLSYGCRFRETKKDLRSCMLMFALCWFLLTAMWLFMTLDGRYY